jgi:two-component system alkaline phosphatase synthesis response regulator PhoP
MQQAAKKRLLFVDDEADYLYLLSSNLEATGFYEVQTVSRSNEALAIARLFKPDVILLDVLMPGVHGPQLALQIRKEETMKETPIIFLTGSNLSEIEEAERFIYQNGLQHSGTRVLIKPTSLESILSCVESVLEGKEV